MFHPHCSYYACIVCGDTNARVPSLWSIFQLPGIIIIFIVLCDPKTSELHISLGDSYPRCIIICLHIKWWSSNVWFSCLVNYLFLGGVLLATCFVALVPFVEKSYLMAFRSRTEMSSHAVNYPYAEITILGGFFLVVFIEQLVTCQHQTKLDSGKPRLGQHEFPLSHDIDRAIRDLHRQVYMIQR